MRKFLVLAPALLLASCRSEQVAFQFQPAASVVAPTLAAPATTPDTLAAAVVVAPAAPATRPASPPTPPRRPKAAQAWHSLPPLAAAMPKLLTRQAVRHLGRRPTTEGAAESGLGRVALFFIGVTLGVLAGLAALVNLIFDVGFFTALGYVAAGLVVLGLLYLLISK